MLIKGRYEIQEIIGSGGMGRVYRAYDKEMGRDVAIKSLADIDNAQALQLFRREWRSLANLNHANVIEIYDSGDYEENGVSRPFFVMPLLRGQTLGQMLALSNSPLPVERVVDIAVRVAEGLQAIHELKLVHRDIKPSNIFVLNNNSIKLIDFGIAQLVGGTTGLVIGTESYMSPEQTTGEQCTAHSDLFSLAVVCYECLTRKKPFTGPDQSETFRQIREGIAQPVHMMNPAVSASISKVIAKAMAKRPQHRWASAAEFGSMLSRAARNESIEALDPSRIATRVERARDAFNQENYELTRDVLRDIEEAGFVDPQVGPLRWKAEQAIREREIRKRLESAERSVSFEEYELALDEINWILRIAPTHQKAIELKKLVDDNVQSRRLSDLILNARRELAMHDYSRARQSLGLILSSIPNHPEAIDLLENLAVREEEYKSKRREKEELYRASRDAFEAKEFNAAITKLRRVLELELEAPETSSGSRSNYRDFLAEAEQANDTATRYRNEILTAISTESYLQAQTTARQAIAAFPEHALFKGLLALADERLRQVKALRHGELIQQACEEENLEKRLSILQQANREFPDNREIELWTQSVQDRLACVREIYAKAKHRHDQGHREQAEERMSYMSDVYPAYFGVSDATRQMPVPKSLSAAAGAGDTLSPGATQMMSVPVQFKSGAHTIFREPPTPAGKSGSHPVEPPPIAPQPPAPIVPASDPFASVKAGLSGAWMRLRESLRSIDFDSHLRQLKNGRLAGIRIGRNGFVGIGAFCLLLLIGGTIYSMMRNREKEAPAAPPPSTVPVGTASLRLTGITPDAKLELDGQTVGIDAAGGAPATAGTHTLRISRTGYQPYETQVNVLAGAPTTVPIPVLTAFATKLIVDADWDGASVRIDDQPIGTVKEKKFEADLPDGQHWIMITKDMDIAKVEVNVRPGEAPAVLNVAPGQMTVVAANLGAKSEVWTNVPAIRTSENELLERGKPLPVSGERSLQLMEGNSALFTFPISNLQQPSVKVHLHFLSRVGSIRFCANQDKFDVMFDTVLLKPTIANNCAVLAGLPSGEHVLRAVKDGFQSVPQTVVVKARSETRAEAALRELPKVAAVKFVNGIPGSEVRIDGQSVGKIGANGTLDVAAAPLGNHKIEISNGSKYKPQVLANVNILSRGMEAINAKLEFEPVKIDFQATLDTTFRFRCPAENSEDKPLKGPHKVDCPEGKLIVSATREGFEQLDQTLVTTGKGGLLFPVNFPFKEKAKMPVKTPKQCGVADLTAEGFRVDKGFYVAKGSLALPCAGLSGRYSMSVSVGKRMLGAKRTEWTIGGSKFSFDGNKFISPAGTEDVSKESKEEVSIQIDVRDKETRQIFIVGSKSIPNAISIEASASKIVVDGNMQIRSFAFVEAN